MKHYLLLIFLLGFSCYCSANDQDPFEEDARKPCEPIQPERGYPNLVPYVKTESGIVSIHSPTISHPPTPLLGMPKVTKLDASLPHTKAGDEVYDITKWFPLHEMRNAGEKEANDLRWVYYNKTSGYVVAYADHFLRASIYDYIDGLMVQNGVGRRAKVNVIYIETGDKVAMDLESIQKSPHKVIFRTSGIMLQGDDLIQRTGEVHFNCGILYANGRKAFDLDLSYSKEGEGTKINTRFRLPASKWVIYECGISEAGVRKVMAVKVGYINQSEQVVHLQSSREDFIQGDILGITDDPFGEIGPFVDCSAEYYQLHRVPSDVVNLLSVDGGEPFEDTSKISREAVDVSELLKQQGVVKVKAHFIPTAGYIIAYADKCSQDQLVVLFMVLDGEDWPLALKCDLNFYEIDVLTGFEKEEWEVIDLLAGNPKKLASIGGMINSGERAECFLGKSSCGFELIRDETGVNVDFMLDLKMNLPLLSLEKALEGSLRIGTPKVVSFGINPKTNRMIMMLMRCREIDGEKKREY